MTRALLSFALLGFVSIGASPAQALGLNGHSLSVAHYAPDASTVSATVIFTPPSFVVGPGQETDGDVFGPGVHLLIDFGDDVLDITFDLDPSNTVSWNDLPFNGPIFTSVLPLEIASATVDASTTMSGFDDSQISFTTTQILLNWAGASVGDGNTLRIHFTFVPEPGGVFLIGCGLFALAFAPRRRAKERA